MKHLIILTLLFSFQANSASKSSLRSEILSSLPKDISSLSKSSGEKEIKKKFGKKIKKSDSDTLYLSYFSPQTDLTIGLDEKKFQYVYLKVPQDLKQTHKNLFKKVYSDLAPSEQRKLLSSGEISHEGGRYLQIDLPKEALTLRFKNNETKDLESIIFWEPGEAKP